MEARPTLHPSPADLRDFALGRISDAALGERIDTHLDSCADCCKAVSDVSGDNFLVRRRQARRSHSTPSPATPGRNPQPAPGPIPLFNVLPELAEHPDYEVLEELGHGGMGVVYKARHRLSDRLEVLKVMNPDLLRQPR